MKKCILVKLDIFSKIGLGHFSRINNLVNADLNTNYFLIYRSDINVTQLLRNSNFKQSFNITKKDNEDKWSQLENYSSITYSDFNSDIKLISSLMSYVETNFGYVHSLIIDNFLVKQEWFDILSENLNLKKLNIIYIDDFNRDFENVNLSIHYSSDKNSLIERNSNKLIAEGLKYTPFSLELVRKRDKILDEKFKERNKNILISFGFFDQMNLSIEVIVEILQKTEYNVILIISKEAPIFAKLTLNYKNNPRVQILNYLPDVSSIYENCSTSIGTFGLMSLEKAYLALPQLNKLEELNQKNTMQSLTMNKFATSFENINELFNSKSSLFMFPKKNLYKDLLSKSAKFFGRGVLEWITLIEMISD